MNQFKYKQPNYNKSDYNFFQGRKSSISREKNNNFQGNKKSLYPRAKSGNNHRNKPRILGGCLNNQNINKGFKSNNKSLPKIKVSNNLIFINNKENENKSKKTNIQTFASSKFKANNNFLYEKNVTPINENIIKSTKNYRNNQKGEIDRIENKYKPEYLKFNYNERSDSFHKKKDKINKRYESRQNFNYDQDNYNNNYLDSYSLKSEEIKSNALNFYVEENKVMNNLKEKEKNFEFNLNFNENKRINEQLNEIKEIKTSNEQYKLIIKGKDNEINSLKQNNELYESIINEKNNGIYSLKQKIIELNKNNEKYQLITKEKDNEIKCLQQKINEANIIIKQCNIFKNKEQELKNKEIEIKKREEEFNKKMNFLEDIENALENEKQKMIVKFQNYNKENKKIKIENNNLILKNQQLQKENQEYESIKIKLQKENAILNQKNLELNQMIQNLENKVQFLENKKINRVISKPPAPFNSPNLIKLNNIGETYFINSILQCLSQTKALADYFLEEKNKNKIKNNNIALKNKNDYQLSPVFLDIIQKIWGMNGPNSFLPNTFMNTLYNLNPLFKTGQTGDAKNFIIFILGQLHKELKKSSPNDNKKKLQLNQYDKNNAFNNFYNDFKKEYSIISDLFFGFNEATNECLNCRNIYYSKGLNNPICYNYGIFNFLVFPLREVKKNTKNNTMQKYNIQINNNRISLYDCFNYNQKDEIFAKNYCNVCKKLYDSIYTSKIFESPKILILILDRGKGNIHDIKIDFNETLDITQFVQEKKDSPQLIYNLYAHIGQSGPNANFVASCKSPKDNKWYRYNDAFVNPINNLQKEVIELSNPYILFYQKSY